MWHRLTEYRTSLHACSLQRPVERYVWGQCCSTCSVLMETAYWVIHYLTFRNDKNQETNLYFNKICFFSFFFSIRMNLLLILKNSGSFTEKILLFKILLNYYYFIHFFIKQQVPISIILLYFLLNNRFLLKKKPYFTFFFILFYFILFYFSQLQGYKK